MTYNLSNAISLIVTLSIIISIVSVLYFQRTRKSSKRKQREQLFQDYMRLQYRNPNRVQ